MAVSADELREQIRAACLEAALEMGPDLKGLSWFYRNAAAHKRMVAVAERARRIGQRDRPA